MSKKDPQVERTKRQGRRREDNSGKVPDRGPEQKEVRPQEEQKKNEIIRYWVPRVWDPEA